MLVCTPEFPVLLLALSLHCACSGVWSVCLLSVWCVFAQCVVCVCSVCGVCLGVVC